MKIIVLFIFIILNIKKEKHEIIFLTNEIIFFKANLFETFGVVPIFVLLKGKKVR